MSDQNPYAPPPAAPPEPPAPPAPPRKRGGWPKGRKRRAKTEAVEAALSPPPRPKLSAAQIKAAADRAERPDMISKMKSRPNWDDDTEAMVGDEGVNRLHIPVELINRLARDGIALQWISRAVRGMETPQEVARFSKGGWTPVHQSDFDGVLDGMFMPKGIDEVIAVDDCMLVARPTAIHQRARQRESALAREPLQIKQAEIGQGLSVAGGDHPTARSQNRINVTRERLEIPD